MITMSGKYLMQSIEEVFAQAWETGKISHRIFTELQSQNSYTSEEAAILDRLTHAIRRGRIQLV